MYWSHCAGSRNFGDILGPAILRANGITVEWAMPDSAELVTVGSVISKLPNGWRGTVLGTGTIKRGIHRNLSRTRVLSVRGALTRDACNLPGRTRLGDLGILTPDLLAGRSDTCPHPVGVLGHHIDRDIAGRHPGAFVINIRSGVPEVIAAAATCERLYVSSLHALILADALGIPHIFEPHPRVIGGPWKFTDYATSMGLKRIVPYVERLTDRAVMVERQEMMRDLVARLR